MSLALPPLFVTPPAPQAPAFLPLRYAPGPTPPAPAISALPRSVRSALPFRLRCAAGPPSRGPQRPSPLTTRTRAEPASPRCATGSAVVAADPRLCGPVASLRLNVRPPLHSGHPTATDCSPVRLTRPSPAKQCQRIETPPPVSAPVKPGARPPSPTRQAATTPAPLAPTAQPARR